MFTTIKASPCHLTYVGVGKGCGLWFVYIYVICRCLYACVHM